jgi:hypothetical protein
MVSHNELVRHVSHLDLERHLPKKVHKMLNTTAQVTL